MALFNKLFSNHKPNKYQDNISEKLFAFNKDHIRIVLFRECDFRGRKLLFDSSTISKVPISNDNKSSIDKFIEISDNFGYIISKQKNDSSQLGEMVFGSVAMSFRGTYFKIHNLTSPNRLMFSHVFPSPRKSHCISVSSQQSPEHSINKLDDSGTSSTSISEQFSVKSVNSDTILVFRERTSVLDVPQHNTVGDSGCSIDHSIYLSNSFCKKCLRRTSLDYHCTNSQSTSFEEFQLKSSHSRSKLGLTFIIEITEDDLIQFLMEHVALIESLLWRTRTIIEKINSQNFITKMMEVVDYSANSLVSLLSDSYISLNLWLPLSNNCDTHNSINVFDTNNKISTNLNVPINDEQNVNKILSNSFNQHIDDGLNKLGRFFKTEFDLFNYKNKKLCCEKKNLTSEKFVQDFCQLLETFDIKDTNFFMSTLITAVLTHHLGWVRTCLSDRFNSKCNIKIPFNPLWDQLSDLFGAVGYPTKMAKTIVTGNDKNDIISKILNSLTYFIRCCDIERRDVIRNDIDNENDIVEKICQKQSYIPMENYKRYEDHLKEIMSIENSSVTKLKKEKSFYTDLSNSLTIDFNTSIDISDNNNDNNDNNDNNNNNNNNKNNKNNKNNVVFVLGDNEELIGLKPSYQSTNLDLNNIFHDSDFIKNNSDEIKPSTSWSNKESTLPLTNYGRSKSVPPNYEKSDDKKITNNTKYKYSGVKFNLQQYPQILSNYMKSKNLEMSNLQFGDKDIKFDLNETVTPNNTIKFEGNFDDTSEGLQTPSNASELEFTSDLILQTPINQQPKESNQNEIFNNNFINPSIKENNHKTETFKIANLPMPKSIIRPSNNKFISYGSSLIKSISEDYQPNMVLQGISVSFDLWESKLKDDLNLTSQHSIIDQPIDEAVAIVANLDKWEVHIMSNHTYMVDRGSCGIRVGMSQLVANMLESFLNLWKLNVPPQYCLMHLENTLQELCLRSKALAQMLLTTEFCSMELLTKSLHLDVNDVPLLLAVASTHTPQVTQKYGLSFQ